MDKDAVSFPDFVHLVVHGPTELAEFIMENQLEGQSLGIDTGMVDAKGESAKWDSYWHQCGLCHKDFKPHYVLHFDHPEEDEKVRKFYTLLSFALTSYNCLRLPHWASLLCFSM